MGTESVVKFEKVTKIYTTGLWRPRTVRALENVSFDVRAGEVFGIVGPNRAGKTTVVKVLLSLCRATKGLVFRLGAPARDRSTLAEIGYVHENPPFPGYLSAEALLGYYGAMTEMSAADVRRRGAELLEVVGLADRCQEPIWRFSKGMVQRLALAQALLNDPRLLILDEPTEGMDLLARRLFHKVVQERRDRGLTTILVSHALTDVAQLCDRVAVLSGGRLTYLGWIDELLDHGDAEHSFEEALELLYAGECT